MDTINEGTLLLLRFRKPFGKWLGPDDICCWLNENPIDRSWSILTGSTIHFAGITLKSDLVSKYKLVTGIELRSSLQLN